MRRLLIVYDSISGNTQRMANLIAQGVQKKISNVIVTRITEAAEKDFKEADAIVFGCPTYNRGLTSDMKIYFEKEVVKLKAHLKGKIGSAFGAYGWSGEAIHLIKDSMKHLGMKVLTVTQDFTGTPDEELYATSLLDMKNKSIEFGETLADQVIQALENKTD
jgi:flavorubredoxin